MFAMLWLLLFPLIQTCHIHEHNRASGFMNVSDLGLAVHENDLKLVENLIREGCDVNYDKTAALFVMERSEYYDLDLLDMRVQVTIILTTLTTIHYMMGI